MESNKLYYPVAVPKCTRYQVWECPIYATASHTQWMLLLLHFLLPVVSILLVGFSAKMTTNLPIHTILSLLEAHPLQLDRYEYGTAGFRYAATVMGPVMVRVGLVARFLLLDVPAQPQSQQTSQASHVPPPNMGVMITASHNDESYNGVKISNPDGSMIGPEQEALLVQWVNERHLDRWQDQLEQLASSTTSTSIGSLHVGRDTRSHSLELSNLLMQAAQAMAIPVINHGVVTTPMLHHIVLYSNNTHNDDGTTTSNPLASRQGYLQQMAQAYVELDQLLHELKTTTKTTKNSSGNKQVVLPPLQVDGACGVGYVAMVDLQTVLSQKDVPYAARFQPRNPPSAGPLNHHCGSEHVQKQLQPPTWYDTSATTTALSSNNNNNNKDDMSYCCSVDGDADRIVFFQATQPWTLLDGDKIAALIAHFFQYLQQINQLPPHLTLGVVQTAYANGASTTYLQVSTIPPSTTIATTTIDRLTHAYNGV